MPTVSVGCDIAKTTFVGAVWVGGTSQGVGTFPNTAAG